ncbi:MAG TPA: hypothetical protein VL992_06095 [Tepidisphaeraceae bacterium]|nr:hypothetical protein [Tepidisphaeraceae bacterium]
MAIQKSTLSAVRPEMLKIASDDGAAPQVPQRILTKARAEMDRHIERQVEPYRVKIAELERRRADIDEELKGLYMIVGFYDSVRMQGAVEVGAA